MERFREKLGDGALAAEIARNLGLQHANNLARFRELRRYATGGFLRVFDLVPVLLNLNAPGVVGYVDDPGTPSGIKFIDRQIWRLPAARRPGAVTAPAARPAVDSLFLIGSSGSVGHHDYSDLDYWVCFEDGSFTPRAFELFQRKLAAVSRWALREHGVEANFYPINLSELAQGRLTRSKDAETEGEVAPLLLMEEFYRTGLLVAGRQPLWPVLPLDLDLDRYRDISRRLAGDPDGEFADLGFPSPPEPQQVLAAALWLAHKSEADPFKALMKMTALTEYLEKGFKCPLLCHEAKAAVLSSAVGELPVDPYVLTIERTVDFGRNYLAPLQLELLRAAAVLRVLGAVPGRPAAPLPESSPKRPLLEEWRRRWGWSRERLAHFADYSRWGERELLELSGEVLKVLDSLYIRISSRLMAHYAKEIDPQSGELVSFAAGLLARQSGLDSTVESLPSRGHLRDLDGRLVLTRGRPDGGAWRLHALSGGADEPLGQDNLVYSGGRAARVAAWLAHNRVITGPGRVAVRPSADGTAALDDLPGLLAELADLFPPFDPGRAGHLWTARAFGRIMVALNFEEGGAESGDILAADLILRTGWGEMRHEYLDLGGLGSLADKYLKITRALIKSGGLAPDNLVFHAQETSPLFRKAAVTIRGALTSTGSRRDPPAATSAQARRLDL